jgi:hypothetical protein
LTSQGCLNKKKLIYFIPLRRVTIVTGWDHKHEGACKLKRGLPPQIKTQIKRLMDVTPAMKLT